MYKYATRRLSLPPRKFRCRHVGVINYREFEVLKAVWPLPDPIFMPKFWNLSVVSEVIPGATHWHGK